MSTIRERKRRPLTTALVYEYLNQLVGRWETETVRAQDPVVVIPGITVIDWMEGARFLVMRSRHDHADVPATFAILGFMDRHHGARSDVRVGSLEEVPYDPAALQMHVYDERGEFRRYRTSISQDAWRLEPEGADEARRFVGSLPSQDCIAGRWQVRGGGDRWEDELRITYRRWEPQR